MTDAFGGFMNKAKDMLGGDNQQAGDFVNQAKDALFGDNAQQNQDNPPAPQPQDNSFDNNAPQDQGFGGAPQDQNFDAPQDQGFGGAPQDQNFGAPQDQGFGGAPMDAAPPAPPAPRSITVNPGDTLWAIAERELGDGNRYQEIANINGIPNPDMIQPGQVLNLP